MTSERMLILIEDERTRVMQGLVAIPAPSLEKYYMQVGVCQGLEKAAELYKSLLREAEEDD